MYRFLIFFCLFMIVSLIGWITEIIYVWIETKTIVNRGFLLGPYCPIYGLSTLIMYFVLNSYKNDLLILFVMSVIICSISEYMISYLMEKVFKARWWDYSHFPFNLNGRICLLNSILFGFGAIILLKWIAPFLLSNLYIFPKLIFYYISTFLLILFITDSILSFNIIFTFKNTVECIKKDHTSEINEKVQTILMNKTYPFKRLIKAFPHQMITGVKNTLQKKYRCKR